MPVVININTSGNFNSNLKTLSRVGKRFPQLARDAMMIWGKILERDMKSSAMVSLNKFTGTLFNNGIRYDQRSRGNIGKLFIRQTGVFSDSMSPHFVSVTRTRTRLLRWASQARSPAIKRKAKLVSSGKLKRFGILVKPHPWINRGYRIARPKLRLVLKQSLARGVTK